MAGYEIEDAQGNRYRISKGAGPDYPHPENIGAGSSLIASGLLQGMPFESLVAANDYFWFDTLCKIPDCPGNPADALANAIASSHLTIEKVGTALAADDEEPDPRAGLRVKIQQALTQIIAGERAEAAMYQRQMDQENILTKGLIYTGSFMEGIGSSAWGAVVWAKEVSDLINPVVIISNHAKAVQAGWESEDFYATYSSNVAMAQKRELVEALGFDPTSITEQQIDEAIAMANLVLDDPSLRDMLYRFVKDYVEAQHAVEITNVAGSGAFEIILTIVLAAVTGGAGVIAAVGSKTALIRKFQKVGDLLSEFAKATRRLKLKARERKAKSRPADFKDLETAEAPVKKTDAHGAETGDDVKTTPARTMKEHDVPCFKAGDKIPASKYAEYEKQLAAQEKGLNDMTVQEYLDGRDAYKNFGRGDGKAQKAARTKYAAKRSKALEQELSDEGIVGEEAEGIIEATIKSELSTLDALHNPDLIAGGKDVVTELGDRSVNRSIGSQWRQKSRVEQLDTAAKKALETNGPDTKMNVSMHRCQ